jgi:hypothetical protein
MPTTRWRWVAVGVACATCACGSDRPEAQTPAPTLPSDAAPAPADAVPPAPPDAPPPGAAGRDLRAGAGADPRLSDGLPAYGGPPGEGTPDASDQFVEFHNRGSAPVDLTGWSFEFRDTAVNVSQLGVHGVLAFSDGSSLAALQPGGFAVLGNPHRHRLARHVRGATRRQRRDRRRRRARRATTSRDMEHDGVGDGAPDRSHNGFARGSFEEAIARPDGAPDTGVDPVDFDAMVATRRARTCRRRRPPRRPRPYGWWRPPPARGIP